MQIDDEIRASFEDITSGMTLPDLINLYTELSAFRVLLRERLLKEIDNNAH